MKTTIPDSLKADLPPTGWGKILSSTPVIMAVLATLLAGLASSEMTRAQYDRALAAQLQSKAGDQWGLFQAKKLKSALQSNTLDLLASTFVLCPVEASSLPGATEKEKAAVELLQHEKLPEIGAALDPKINAAIDAVGNLAPESAIAPLLVPIDSAALDRAMESSTEQMRTLDAGIKPAEQALALLNRSPASRNLAISRDFMVLRLRHNVLRYDAEARLNQVIANLYELEVRKANVSAERHHFRSQRFFYGMLGAQMSVIIATLAIAARQRSLLWSLAAAAGLGAVGFAAYIYLHV